jgi:hypothetical protein
MIPWQLDSLCAENKPNEIELTLNTSWYELIELLKKLSSEQVEVVVEKWIVDNQNAISNDLNLRIKRQKLFTNLWDNVNDKSVGMLRPNTDCRGVYIYYKPIFESWKEMINNRGLIESGSIRLLYSPQSAIDMAQDYDNKESNTQKFKDKYGKVIDQNSNGYIIQPEFPVQLPEGVKQATFYIPNGWSVEWMWVRLYERCQKFGTDLNKLICYSNFGFASHRKLSGNASIPEFPHIHFFYEEGSIPDEFFG